MITPIITEILKLNRLLEEFNSKLIAIKPIEDKSTSDKKVGLSDDLELNRYLFEIESIISNLTLVFNRLNVFRDRFDSLAQVFAKMVNKQPIHKESLPLPDDKQ